MYDVSVKPITRYQVFCHDCSRVVAEASNKPAAERARRIHISHHAYKDQQASAFPLTRALGKENESGMEPG